MGVRDRLDRVAAWFGFGVEEDDYYDEEDERHTHAKDRHAGDAPESEPRPTVRRLGRTDRSSAFGTSIGDLFGSEGSAGRGQPYDAQGGGSQAHLRAVPDSRVPPTRVSVIDPSSFNDAQALADAAHAKGALLIAVFNPISLGLLPPPGSYDADIAVAEGQPLGIMPQFGGPGVGIFCCRKQFVRFAPGRLVGTTTDDQGRAGFTLTLQTREQHIRREKATSNICTNQALCALMATVYLGAMGAKGIKTCAEQCYHKAHYAAQRLTECPGFELAFKAPFFHEFALRTPAPVAEINRHLLKNSIIGGYDVSRDYLEYENVMLLCCTEKRTREEIDALADALREFCHLSWKC